MRRRWSFRNTFVAPFLLLPLSQQTPLLNAQACSGEQARNETTSTTPPKTLFVPPNQNFHVNVDAITNALTTTQAADIIKGLRAWAGTNGLTLTFDSSAPGIGVVTVQLGSASTFPTGSDGYGQAIYGANAPGGTNLPNQITGGLIKFDLNYQIPNCAGTTSCPAYDSSAPNADDYLMGLASHEFGHVLGLDDTIDAGTNHQTSTSVMGGR